MVTIAFEQHKLSNGMDVILHEDHTIRWWRSTCGITSAPRTRRWAAPDSPTCSST